MKQPMASIVAMLAIATFLALSGCTDPPAQGDDGARTPSPEAAASGDAQSDTGMADSAEPGEAAQSSTSSDDTAQQPDAAAPDADAQAVGSNTDADVDQAIDALLGDHVEYRQVFDRLQQAVESDDRAEVASLVVYPLEVRIGGKPRKIANAKAFVDAWDGIMVTQVKDVITRQRYRDVFVNWQGVMFGDGQVWINGICQDKDCKKVNVGVTAIQEATQ